MEGAMQDGSKKPQPKKARPQSREDRLKAALKSNMARRKAQAKERAAEGDNGVDSDKEDE
jgi:hypothetical protein